MTNRSLATPGDRSKLPPRREPYWHSLGNNRAIGFRRMSENTPGSWIARFTPKVQKPVAQSLPDVLEVPDAKRFTPACDAANAWFQHLGASGPVKAVTVRTVRDNYIEHIAARLNGKPV